MGQVVVALLKAWIRRIKLREARELEGIEGEKGLGQEVMVAELGTNDDGERTREGSIEGSKKAVNIL